MPGPWFGSPANGIVGAALAYGSIRLDTESRYVVDPGFSGAGVWSPDYGAVIGIVTAANSQGDGIAITLARAAEALPGERLRLLADQTVESDLDTQLRNAFIAELSRVFSYRTEPEAMLIQIGVPTSRIRSWESFRDAHYYWEAVITDLENGLVPNGLAALSTAAVEQYPGNRIFQETEAAVRGYELATNRPSLLTPREHQIAALVASGRSNKAIAEELSISASTAARHVANILAKLGFTSRAQIAAWVADRPDEAISAEVTHRA